MKVLTECNLAQIVFEIQSGKTVIFPTETSYGLGCDATNQEAVNKIFKIKGRSNDKPLLVVVPNVEMAKKYLVWNETLKKIAAIYWPGPVTVVGEVKSNQTTDNNLATGVISKDNTIAIRVTADPFLQSITEKLGQPLVATSANIADAGDIYRASDILTMFEKRKEQPDIVLDYGQLPKRPPTTIVSVVENEIKILRQGEVKIEV